MKQTAQEIRIKIREIEELNKEYEIAKAFKPETEAAAEKAREKIEELSQKIMKLTFSIKKELQKAEKEVAQNA
jgi:hypothetical protein